MENSKPLLKILLAFALFLQLGACASTQSSLNEIEVSGKVEVIGSSLVKGYMLKTDDRNSYLLDLSDEMARAVNAEFPRPIKVRGRLYLGDWVGEKQACIEVISWEIDEKDA